MKGAGGETAIVQALRGLIVQIKVAAQSTTNAPAKKPAETVCKGMWREGETDKEA